MLASFKGKLNAARPSKLTRSTARTISSNEISPDIDSTTPDGSPAPGFNPLAGLQQPAQQSANGATNTSSILKALADMAKQNTAAPAAPAASMPSNPLAALTGAVPQPVSSADSAAGANPYAGGAMANPLAALSGLAQNPAMAQPQSQSQTPNPLAGLLPQAAAIPSQPAPGATTDPNALGQQLQLIQMLAAQGIPQDQWGTALQLFNFSNPAAMGGMNAGQMPPAFNAMAGQGVGGWGRPDSQNRDRERERDYPRSPPGGYRRRSRSPGWDRRRTVSPPRRRESPVYGDYHDDSPGRRGGDPRDARGRRGGNEYRQRSPPGRRRRSPSPPRRDPNLPPPGPKFLEWDYSIGQGSIKVLSRTLFVGGVTAPEAHLRSLFGKFGLVQTCIVNIDKRHAFIKMISRNDAISARDGMESYRAGDMQLRVSLTSFGFFSCSILTHNCTDSMGCRIRSPRLQRLPDRRQHYSDRAPDRSGPQMDADCRVRWHRWTANRVRDGRRGAGH